jgi:hypothetical protein
MSNKYEQLVEFIINDETDKARELFHQIVVEKSRDIYESLVSEEDLAEVGGNEVEELVDEVSLDEEGLSEEEEEGEEGAEELAGEEEAELGAEEENGEDIEDRVVDLESALDELKAEFDALMAGEEHEEEAHPGIHGDEGAEEEQSEFFEAKEEDDEEDEEDEEDLDESIVREYVEKVADTNQKNPSGKMAGTGAKTPQSGDKNVKSVVASKNDMGGSAKNIAGGGSEVDPNGTTPNSSVKPKGDLIGKVNNTPGADAGKTAFKTKESSTGAEGKLAGADGSRPINKASVIKTTPR